MSPLLGGLGLAAWLLATLWTWQALRARLGGTAALAAAYAAQGAWAWAWAQALGMGQAVALPGIAASWMLAAAIAWGARRGSAQGPWLPGSLRQDAASQPWLAGTLALVAALTLVVAAFGAPNTYDGVAYHLPRAAAWLQQGRVAPFATHDLRQAFFAPLGEVLQMDLYALGCGDGFLNLAQWSAFIVAGLLVWGETRRLGGPWAAFLALALCWSAPMVIAEASSPQNDLICAAFCAAALVLSFRAADRGAWGAGIWAGLALGCACLVKPTSYLFLAPWMLAAGALALRRGKASLLALALSVPVFVLLQAPFWSWNLNAGFGCLGPNTGTRLEQPGLRNSLPSILKQAALHLPPYEPLQRAGIRALDAGLRAAGQDPVDSGSTSYWYRPEFDPEPGKATDSTAANWAAVLLFLALPFAVRRWDRRVAWAWGLALLSALVFGALVKWQPWASRLHTPWFVIAALATGLGLARLPRKLAAAAVALALLGGLPALLHLEERPLLSGQHSVLRVPRWDQYFRGKDRFRGPVHAFLDTAAHASCRRFALVSGGDDPTFLLYEGLRRQGIPFEIREVDVHNETAPLQVPVFTACAVWPVQP